MTHSVTVAQMRSHVRHLCEANRIVINYDRHASASRELREIWIRAVRSPRAYAVALNEIGHVCGGYQLSRSTLVRERQPCDGHQRCGGTRIGASNTTRGKSLFRNKELTRPIGRPAGESNSERKAPVRGCHERASMDCYPNHDAGAAIKVYVWEALWPLWPTTAVAK